MKNKKITSINLVTKNVSALAAFYQSVLGVPAEGDAQFTTFDLDGVRLCLCHADVMQGLVRGLPALITGNDVILEFEVDDVDVAYDQLRALRVQIVKKAHHPTLGLALRLVQ